ncbi:putative MATE family efflux protein [Bacteroides zoogleoformans]|uniref:Multidrug-efflux transporter n=1 Tax=Bacteroides zoogleoformans TaxID=28119 RepID=A0ABM6TAH1_9BACE|nr:MATE family efflux transporter [Bacteroides zoogleoformans]AVM53749.1 MATE family efflux transporter [Bacteroides zoogleoformans]TWJ18161.1 putative MATE family efflux protein [Bacteroides zoogleoformans]
MTTRTEKTNRLLALIREGKPMTLGQQLRLTVQLSIPAVIAQLSSIVMQYIDAAMVGSLGAEASASIGLVSTTTWLFWGLCAAVTTGFSVQVAHKIGAGDMQGARAVLRQSLIATLGFGLLLAVLGVAISDALPGWLGGDVSIRHNASLYFLIFSLFLPALQMNFLAGGMLRCSGNMHVPSMLGVTMCILDVLFNFFLIFPSREWSLASHSFTMPGAGLGVVGAALGTVLAEAVVAGILLWYLWNRSGELKLGGEQGGFRPKRETLKKALHISLPMGLEHFVICAAQIMTTVIVAPLGVFAIAANSFAITAESLCYMPGYGIADAATTLVGQSLGAKRRRLTRSFARITVFMGMAIMGVMGVAMYIFAPQIIGLMTPVEDIRELAVMALRIEAFAEPMFAASIVGYGVFVGAADTLIPCLMNFLSIWMVRLSLAALLAPTLGLKGVWIAMCVELCFRGMIFLIHLKRERWMKKI